jgi:hypothetical protein
MVELGSAFSAPAATLMASGRTAVASWDILYDFDLLRCIEDLRVKATTKLGLGCWQWMWRSQKKSGPIVWLTRHEVRNEIKSESTCASTIMRPSTRPIRARCLDDDCNH